MTTYNVLIIEDHPIIAIAYQNTLQLFEKNNKVKFNTHTCTSIIEALQKIKNTTYDLFFLDILLPPSIEDNILNGEQLGVKIRELYPNTKIIVATSLSNNHKIQSIINKVNPDAFLIKNDIAPPELLFTIETVLMGKTYFSDTVHVMFKKIIGNNFSIDEVDQQILLALSKGVKTKNLPDNIPLSLSGIEKRKRNLKEKLNIVKATDGELVIKAKERGLI